MAQAKRYLITDASTIIGVEKEFIIHCIQAHWIKPAGSVDKIEEDFLDEEDLARLRLIRDLKIDLGVNEESIPIILHLLDQLYALRAQIRKRAA